MELYPKFDCATCTTRLQRDRGCVNPAPIHYWTDIKGVPRNRCPRRPILDNPHLFNRVIQAYNDYNAGFLPNAGAIYDQHAKFSKLMSIVTDTIDKCRETKNSKPSPQGGQSLLYT